MDLCYSICTNGTDSHLIFNLNPIGITELKIQKIAGKVNISLDKNSIK